jgi:hypothetical protein
MSTQTLANVLAEINGLGAIARVVLTSLIKQKIVVLARNLVFILIAV